jgi:hypothetical protein
MFVKQCRQFLPGLLAACAVAVFGPAAAGGEKLAIADNEVAAWVDQRVQERQPEGGDRLFDEVGWAKDLRDALRLAREHNRPVFLFTHDGRINLGRC